MSRPQKRAFRRQNWLRQIRDERTPALKSVVEVPPVNTQIFERSENGQKGALTEMKIQLLKRPAETMSEEKSPAYCLQKCMTFLQKELEKAIEEESKSDLRSQIEFVKKMQDEVQQRCATGAIFLDG